MALLSAYSQALNELGTMGSSDWRYVAVIPSISASGAMCKLLLKGPPTGSMRVAAMFCGSQSGVYGFGPDVVPVTIGGQSDFELTANQERWSDLLPLELIAGQSVVVAYDSYGGAGRGYRKQSGLPGFSLHYKAGFGGASNGDLGKSGYTSAAGAFALVVAISVGDAGDFSSSPSGDAGGDSLWAQLRATVKQGEAFVSGGVFAGGELPLHVGLYNQPGSGREDWLDQIIVTPEQDTIVSVRAIHPINQYVPVASDIIGSRCNANFTIGAPASVTKLYRWYQPIVQGQHEPVRLKGGAPYAVNKLLRPLLYIPSGGYIGALAIHTPSVGATVNFHWTELPAA